MEVMNVKLVTNQKNVEGQKKRLKVDLQKVGIKQNLKKIQRIQGD